MTSLNQKITTLENNSGNTTVAISNLESSFTNLSTSKQDKINTDTTLQLNTLHADVLTVEGGDVAELISALETNKQDKLIGGDNITISGYIISSTGGTTIDSTIDLTCNTLTTLGDVSINGVLSLNNQPRFLAYYNGATSPLTVNSGSVIPYGALAYNIGGGYSTSNYSYTVPENGLYFFLLVCFLTIMPGL